MRSLILIGLSLVLAANAFGQQDAEAARAAAEAERQRYERELAEAETRLQAAAAELARLNRALAPDVRRTEERVLRLGEGPRIGVQLGSRRLDGNADDDGVIVMSVLPGGAAERAGVAAGDVLVAIAGNEFGDADARDVANIITDRLEGAEIGDTLDVTVLRDGRRIDYTLTLDEASFEPSGYAFAFGGMPPERVLRLHRGGPLVTGSGDFEILTDGGPGAGGFAFIRADSPWASMQLVELNAGLGQYFGTDSGLLVVRAPSDAALGFEDGDVIKTIGGRTPANVGHAMRILRSYQPGESLQVEVLRQRRTRTLDIEVPETVGARDGVFDDGFELFWQSTDNESPAPSG